MRAETLVAVDFGPGASGVVPDIARVVERMGDALVSVDTGTRPHWRTGEPQTVHRVVFDAHVLRNTEAHGIGYHAGFVSHIE